MRTAHLTHEEMQAWVMRDREGSEGKGKGAVERDVVGREEMNAEQQDENNGEGKFGISGGTELGMSEGLESEMNERPGSEMSEGTELGMSEGLESEMNERPGSEMSEGLDSEIAAHLSYCTTCQKELAAYRLMFPILETMPAAAFEFDVAEMVLANLPERQVAASLGMVMVYLMVGVGVLTGLGALLVLTRYLQFNLIAGIGSVIIVSVLVFQLKEMIRQYQKQMQVLEHY